MADVIPANTPQMSDGPNLGVLPQQAHNITPQLQAAIDQYFSQKPDQRRVFEQDYGGDMQKWLDAFLGWWDGNGASVGDKLGTEFAPEMGLLQSLGYQPGNTQPQPLEQTLLSGALPGLLSNVNADAGRQDLANQLQTDAVADYNATRGLLGNALGGGQFDAAGYLQRNQDVRAAFDQQGDGPTPGTKMINGQPMTAEQFAKWHYDTYGKAEGRQATLTTSLRLQQENAMADQTAGTLATNARTAANSQLGALQTAIGQMQGSLQGELAARAAALQQQIASLNQNLDQYDSTQRKALADQIAAEQANLEQAVTSQRQNLQTELDQLNAAAGTQAQSRRAALQQEIQTLSTATDEQSTARRAALQQELTTLTEAAGTQAQSKRDALQTEIAGLTAAQAPMSAARIASAEALTTAVNLGLESTKDQLSAEQAKAGYLGGSTMGDASLARATIGARQQAAQAMAGAKEANASDVRTIGTRAATEGRGIENALADTTASNSVYGAGQNRSLADELANNRFGLARLGAEGEAGIATNLADTLAGISTHGATSGRALSDSLATGRRAIGDQGAAGTAAITNATGLGRMNIGNAGATGTYNDAIYGAGAGRSLADQLSQGTYGISTNLATQLQGAADKGAIAKQNYFDNDYTRSLQLASTLPSLTNNLASTTTNLAGLGTAGLNNTLNTLNWWNSNSQPQPLGTYAQQPSQAGNGLGNLGAGLTGAALQFANAQNWWQTPPVRAGVGAPTSYAAFLQANPNSWAATGQPVT